MQAGLEYRGLSEAVFGAVTVQVAPPPGWESASQHRGSAQTVVYDSLSSPLLPTKHSRIGFARRFYHGATRVQIIQSTQQYVRLFDSIT